jgi:hypothetical protein
MDKLNPYSRRLYNAARRNLVSRRNYSNLSHAEGRAELRQRLFDHEEAEAAQKARIEENERWNKLSFLGRMFEDCFGRSCSRRGGSYKKKASRRKRHTRRAR